MESDIQIESVKTISFSEFPAYLMNRETEKESSLYCVLDGASDKTIYPMLKSSRWDFKCLYKKNVHFEGERMVDELAATAPYLLKLDPARMSIESVIGERLGKNQMIVFESSAPMLELVDHCSSMLKAMDEDGKVINFRFYDPRILRVYLPTCTDEEIYIFFGDMYKVWADGEDEVMLEFDKETKEFVEEKIEEPVPEQMDVVDVAPQKVEPIKGSEEESGGGFGVMGDFF